MIPSLSASPNLLAKTYKGFKTSKCLKYSFWPVMQAHKLAKSLKIFVKNDTAIKYFQCFVRRHHPEERQEQFWKFTWWTRYFPSNISIIYPVDSETQAGMNSKEISSRGNFSDQGTDGYKTLSHVSVDHTLIVQRSLACYTHLETFSTHFLGSYLSQYGWPLQAWIGNYQVPVYWDFK